MKSLFHICIIALLACSKKSVPVDVAPATSSTRLVNVKTSTELKTALANAQAGDEIVMADGTYSGKFVIAPGVHGTAAKSIILRGSRNAILDAGDINTGYVLYLQSDFWNLKGFTITNGLKGLMIDGAHHCVIDGIKVFNIGEEGIHLRKYSSHNTIQNADISNTGLKTPDYGEGIYIGSAKNNWATYTNGNPDLCDSNLIYKNTIGPNVAAECIDVKEGTTGGIIRENSFNATGITGANSGDSWIDVKGNYTLIESNHGTNPGGSIFKDGYQVHCAVSGWGNYNEFKNNNCVVNATGYGFNVQLSGSNGTTTGNKVYSNNTVTGAAAGVANIPLSN
ncbi:right-handed parallel beta-helix repeat-containing protein [Ferruginibacter sp.]